VAEIFRSAPDLLERVGPALSVGRGGDQPILQPTAEGPPAAADPKPGTVPTIDRRSEVARRLPEFCWSKGDCREVGTIPIQTWFCRPGRFRICVRRSAVGQIERLPPPRLSARYVIRQETSAGVRGKGRNAPIPAVRLTTTSRL
jgi:hypothetical protein